MRFFTYIIITLLAFQFGNTQEEKVKMYYDEIGNPISKKLYDKKLSSPIFHAINFDLRDTIHNKNQWSYYLGKLEPSEKSTLSKSFEKHQEIDTSKIIVIHYEDTLKSPKSFSKIDTIINNAKNRFHKHLITYKTYLDNNKKCLEYFKKMKHSKIYHFFGKREEHPLEIDNLKWYEDLNNSIFKVFGINYKSSKTIVIHPNGNYFIYFLNDNSSVNRIYKKLIKNKGWEKEKRRFLKSIEDIQSYH